MKYPNLYFYTATANIGSFVAENEDDALDQAYETLRDNRPKDFDWKLERTIKPKFVENYKGYDIVNYHTEWEDETEEMFAAYIPNDTMFEFEDYTLSGLKNQIDERKKEFPNPDAITDIREGWWF